MKRPIKFRGVNARTGEFVFGFYVEDVDGVNIVENGYAYLVEPESVAQLVGYDVDGNEIYEGDWLVLKNGTEYQARLFDNGIDTAKLKEKD